LHIKGLNEFDGLDENYDQWSSHEETSSIDTDYTDDKSSPMWCTKYDHERLISSSDDDDELDLLKYTKKKRRRRSKHNLRE